MEVYGGAAVSRWRPGQGVRVRGVGLTAGGSNDILPTKYFWSNYTLSKAGTARSRPSCVRRVAVAEPEVERWAPPKGRRLP